MTTRLADGAVPGLRPAVEILTPIDARPYLAGLEERFGMAPESFDEYFLFRPSSRRLAIADRRLWVPETLELLAAGMPFLYVARAQPRLTNAAAVKFGGLARRNLVDLDPTRLERLLLRQPVPLLPAEIRCLTGAGDVIVRHGELVVGLCLAREAEDGFVLEARLPRSWLDRLSLEAR